MKRLLLSSVFMLAVYTYVALVTVTCGLNASFCFHRYTTPLDQQLAPYRYRVVSYVLEDAFAESDTLQGIPFGALQLHVLLFLITFGALYLWLRRWMSFDRAVIGLLMVIGLLPMAYRIDMLNTSSIIEMGLVCIFLLAVNRFSIAVIVLIVATLNRETALLLIPLYGVMQWGKDGWVKRILVLTACYILVTAGLHIVLGAAPHEYGLDGTWALNQSQFANAIFINLLFVPFGFAVLYTYQSIPRVLQAFMWITGVYVVSSLIGGMWIETPRLFMPVYPLLLIVILRGSHEAPAR